MKISAHAAIRNAVYLTGVSALAALILSGCGSGGGSAPQSGLPSSVPQIAANRAKGSVSFTVKWPERTRLVPVAANSIRVTLLRNAVAGLPAPQPITQVLTRPAAGQPLTTTTTFSNLELGPYVATATAFPSTDASGVAQATGPVSGQLGSATVPVTVKAGLNPGLTLTMNTTIAALTISPATGPFLRASDTRLFTVTATDASGAIVIINQSVKWSVAPPGGPFSLVVNGAQATLQYTGGPLSANTTATVTAVESESGLSASATATFVAVGPVSPLSTWGKFHANAQNTGQAALTTGFANATGVNVSGFPVATLAQIEFSSPAIALDGTIYVGANDNNLYAFTPSGSIKWKFPTGGFVESSPSIGRDGTIYVGSLDGNVYALQDAGTSANVIWKTAADGPVFGSPTIDANGYLYVASTTPGHTLYKLDSLNGAVIWQFNAPTDGMQDAPALNLSEGMVFVGSLDFNVYAVRTSDGVQQWKYPTGAPIYSSSPAVARVGLTETVFIGSLDGKMYAINAISGGTVWTYDTGTPIYTSPAVAPNPTQGGALAVYFATFDNTGGNGNQVFGVSAAGTAGGQPQSVFFAQTFAQGFTSSPAVTPDGSLIYIGCYDGNVYGLNTTNGSAAFAFATPPAPAGSLPEQFDSSPGIAPNGTIYIGGFSGNLYAIK